MRSAAFLREQGYPSYEGSPTRWLEWNLCERRCARVEKHRKLISIEGVPCFRAQIVFSVDGGSVSFGVLAGMQSHAVRFQGTSPRSTLFPRWLAKRTLQTILAILDRQLYCKSKFHSIKRLER